MDSVASVATTAGRRTTTASTDRWREGGRGSAGSVLRADGSAGRLIPPPLPILFLSFCLYFCLSFCLSSFLSVFLPFFLSFLELSRPQLTPSPPFPPPSPPLQPLASDLQTYPLSGPPGRRASRPRPRRWHTSTRSLGKRFLPLEQTRSRSRPRSCTRDRRGAGGTCRLLFFFFTGRRREEVTKTKRQLIHVDNQPHRARRRRPWGPQPQGGVAGRQANVSPATTPGAPGLDRGSSSVESVSIRSGTSSVAASIGTGAAAAESQRPSALVPNALTLQQRTRTRLRQSAAKGRRRGSSGATSRGSGSARSESRASGASSTMTPEAGGSGNGDGDGGKGSPGAMEPPSLRGATDFFPEKASGRRALGRRNRKSGGALERRFGALEPRQTL